MEHISKYIGNAIKDKLEWFEVFVINNHKLVNQMREECLYNNSRCKRTVMDELMYGIESKLIDDVISNLENKPFYYFYEIYADPACPQILKESLSANDFFCFSCYIHEMGKNGSNSRKEIYDISEVAYKKDQIGFLRMVREYGLD